MSDADAVTLPRSGRSLFISGIEERCAKTRHMRVMVYMERVFYSRFEGQHPGWCGCRCEWRCKQDERARPGGEKKKGKKR